VSLLRRAHHMLYLLRGDELFDELYRGSSGGLGAVAR
jgi:hypothetical protein